MCNKVNAIPYGASEIATGNDDLSSRNRPLRWKEAASVNSFDRNGEEYKDAEKLRVRQPSNVKCTCKTAATAKWWIA